MTYVRRRHGWHARGKSPSRAIDNNGGRLRRCARAPIDRTQTGPDRTVPCRTVPDRAVAESFAAFSFENFHGFESCQAEGPDLHRSTSSFHDVSLPPSPAIGPPVPTVSGGYLRTRGTYSNFPPRESTFNTVTATRCCLISFHGAH